ncbi:MAG: hypothetical protein NTZ34_06895 [Chloroflexi bacterium]|nr:hypothetical protein [Chloroflexota bacterium]
MKTNNLADTHQLMAIITCDQSDGYLKNWAREKIRESEYPRNKDTYIDGKYKITLKQDLSRD